MSEEDRPILRPKKQKTETYWQKTVRKCSAEPFVPIGGIATAGILIAGLSSFTQRDRQRSQYWMRMRVLAQGLTIIAIALGSEFIKPNKPALYEEAMERKATAEASEKTWKPDQN